MQAIAPNEYASAQKDLKNARTIIERQTVFNRALQNFLISYPEYVNNAAEILNIQNQPIETFHQEHQWQDGKLIVLLTPTNTTQDLVSLIEPAVVILLINGQEPRAYSISAENIEKTLNSITSTFNSTAELDIFLSDVLRANSPNSNFYGVLHSDYLVALNQAQKILTPEDKKLNPTLIDFFNWVDKNTVLQLTEDQVDRKNQFAQAQIPENARNYLRSLFANQVILAKFLGTYFPPTPAPGSTVKSIETNDNFNIRLTTTTNADGKKITILTSTYLVNGSFKTTILEGDLSNFPFENEEITGSVIQKIIDTITIRTDLAANQQSFLLHIALEAYKKFALTDFEISSFKSASEPVTKVISMLPDNDAIKNLDSASNRPSTQRILIKKLESIAELDSSAKKETFILTILAKAQTTALYDIADILGLDTPENLRLPRGKEIRDGLLANYIPRTNTTELRFYYLSKTIILNGDWLNFNGFENAEKIEDVLKMASDVAAQKQLTELQQMQFFRILNNLTPDNSRAQKLANMLNGGKIESLPQIIGQNPDALKDTMRFLGIPMSASSGLMITLTNPLNNDIITIVEEPTKNYAIATIGNETLDLPLDLLTTLQKNENFITAQEFSELYQMAKEATKSPQQIGLTVAILTNLAVKIAQKQEYADLSKNPLLANDPKIQESLNTLKPAIDSLKSIMLMENASEREIQQLSFLIEDIMAIDKGNYQDIDQSRKRVLTDITNIAKYLGNETLRNIAWALGINTVVDQKPDGGTVTVLYDSQNDQSIIKIAYKTSFNADVTVERTFNGNWMPLDHRMSISTDNSSIRLAGLFNLLSESAGNLSADLQFLTFQILDEAGAMDLSELNNFSDPNSSISKIAQTISDAKSDSLQNTFESFKKQTIFAKKQTELMNVIAAVIKEDPKVITKFALALNNKLETEIAPKTTPVVASSATDVGGIDFNPNLLDLQIKRNGRGVPLPLPMQDIDKINIEGLYPVILNISPAKIENLPFLMGTKPVAQTDKLSLVR